jgi:mono/diheme cytochrome c family protein
LEERVFTVLIALLVGCNGDGKDTGSGGGDPVAGATVYTTYCTTCHGDDGKLGAPTGKTTAADLTVEVPEQSDAELETIIMDGYGVMPPQTSDPTEVADVIAYLRETFGEYEGAE